MKADRQEKIIELIREYEIETQEDLAARLRQAGYDVTQATVSRDIKALRLEKVSSGTRSRYVYPERKEPDENRSFRVFADAYSEMIPAANLVVIKTGSGMAMAAAAALDKLNIPEIAGSIAGDDTILCATRSNEDAQAAIAKLQSLLKTI